MDNVQTGKLIAELRKQQGLTQQQLAERLNLSNKTISKWESGAGSPDISNLEVLADTLGISVDELLRGKLNDNAAEKTIRDSEHGISTKESTYERKKEMTIIILNM